MDDEHSQPSPRELRRVDLLALPVMVHRRAADQSATLRREMALVAASGASADVPSRLLHLARELSERYAGFGSDSDAVMQEAMADGVATVDLHYDVPVDVVDVCLALDTVLDEVDEYCRTGNLVTLVSPPEVQAYRRWFLGQFVSQLRDGEGPSPWVAPDETGDTGVHEAPPQGATIVVDDDLDLEGSARMRAVIADRVAAGVETIVLDLAGCEFIDSVGISLLLTTLTRLRQVGGSLTLTNVRPQPLSALRTAGVVDLLMPAPG